jgi:hypothetical protein
VKKFLATAVLILATLIASPASAQMNGENLLGDMGVKSGTQPEPGLYTGSIYYRYFTDKIFGPDGRQVVFDPTGAGGQQTIHAAVPMAIYVSKKKFLGAHIGMMAVMPLANGSLEAPGLGLSESATAGASDMYIMPAQLGWHFKRADATAGVAFFAPTGRHTAGASDNLGKGMWSYEVSGGTTVYLDKARSFSIGRAPERFGRVMQDADEDLAGKSQPQPNRATQHLPGAPERPATRITRLVEQILTDGASPAWWHEPQHEGGQPA